MAPSPRLESVEACQLVELALHARDGGELVVVEEGKALPYAAARVFTVRAGEGAVRGRHAHKQCSQFMLCVHGAIEVECDDGASKKTFVLDAGNKGLMVPPSIWATETYKTAGAVLTVLCDRPYEAEDYIRDYDEFVAYRRGSREP